MRLLLFEWLTGGGSFPEALAAVLGSPRAAATTLSGNITLSGGPTATTALDQSLAEEARTMVEALLDDLHRLPDVTPVLLWDSRLKIDSSSLPSTTEVHRVHCGREVGEQFSRLAETCDAALLVAPEIDGLLLQWTSVIERLESLRRLGPDCRFIRLAADKFRLPSLLSRAGVPAIPSWMASGDRAAIRALSRRWPKGTRWVMKPRWGAGCWQISRGDDLERLVRVSDLERGERIVQPWMAGEPASIAAIGDGHRYQLLPPCRQIIREVPCPVHASLVTLKYVGGRRLTEPALVDRAVRLGQATFRALPPTTGYVGIDFVLGPDQHGREDFVVEVNPRLTTSGCAIRRMILPNLVQLLIDPNHSLQWNDLALSFDSSGRIDDYKENTPNLTTRCERQPCEMRPAE